MRCRTQLDADKLKSLLRSKAADEDIKGALQRLDRLTQDELRNVAAQTLGVVGKVANDVNELKSQFSPNISQYFLEVLRLSGRCPDAERYLELALPPRSMEELQHRPRITAQRDRVVVCQQQDILGMESFWTKFPTMGLWETSVTPDSYIFADTDDLPFPFRSGRWEKRPLVRQRQPVCISS